MAEESPLQDLLRYGQSPWLDFIHRHYTRSGKLESMMVHWGLCGITSNPAIFERAIAHGDDYDDEIRRLARTGWDANAIYETLAVTDVREAADLFRPLYEKSQGQDGFVSLEVSPRLAYDTDTTVQEARRLWRLLDRPNVLIKVPATRQGLPAIQQLLADGINVNVTLLFSLERYREVTEAYLAGIEDAASAGYQPTRIASVASFFLSRIDSMIDPMLDSIISEYPSVSARAATLRGEIAVASAKRAYALFEQVFDSARFRRLAGRGARPQRLLWASTGTKNPDFSDIRYIEPLIGPYTVSTLPLATLEAYHDHGSPAPRLHEGIDEAARVLEELIAVGIDLDEVTDRLLTEGVAKFVEPFDNLLSVIEDKRCTACA